MKPSTSEKSSKSTTRVTFQEVKKESESSESETENTTYEEDSTINTNKVLLLADQLSENGAKRHLTIKDIGVILDRISSKVVDVERLERSVVDDSYNWSIKATIKGDSLRELGVLYHSHYYTIGEHPDTPLQIPVPQQSPISELGAIKEKQESEKVEEIPPKPG